VARTPSAEYLILDIETVPDIDRWQRPDLANAGEPAFPPSWAHRIIVIGCLWLGHDYELKRFGVIGGEPVARDAPGDGPGGATGDARRRRARAPARPPIAASAPCSRTSRGSSAARARCW
jgi:hypothetical protein